jgi:hypothetical protein
VISKSAEPAKLPEEGRDLQFKANGCGDSRGTIPWNIQRDVCYDIQRVTGIENTPDTLLRDGNFLKGYEGERVPLEDSFR